LENNEFIKTSNDDKLLIFGFVPLKNVKWARKFISIDELGPEIASITDLDLKIGDVIFVEENGVFAQRNRSAKLFHAVDHHNVRHISHAVCISFSASVAAL
jgi:hypothetical protein